MSKFAWMRRPGSQSSASASPGGWCTTSRRKAPRRAAELQQPPRRARRQERRKGARAARWFRHDAIHLLEADVGRDDLVCILFMCLKRMMSEMREEDAKMSITPTTESRGTPGSPPRQPEGRRGSTTVMSTRAHLPRRANTHLLPTSPWPQTRASSPPIVTSVAHMTPSGRKCLQP